jgi:hypothetical protein
MPVFCDKAEQSADGEIREGEGRARILAAGDSRADLDTNIGALHAFGGIAAGVVRRVDDRSPTRTWVGAEVAGGGCVDVRPPLAGVLGDDDAGGCCASWAGGR